MAAEKKINPYDVEALERSLNDSATRVSAIWVTFLIFGLYLVIAAGTVTHRQLLLEEPVKLPVLNIDLPLVGFFFLAPILFVIFHAYVLLQVLLLGRTAAAYNEAVEKAALPAEEDATMRQRLANTLFAQIFAGSPRERTGWLGWLLKAMAWITLAIAPVLILVFQSKFLPYHSETVTWAIRVLIVIDLAIVLILWPAARDPGHEVTLRGVFRQWIALPVAIAIAAFASIVLSFPGEHHAEWTRYWPDEKSRSNARKLGDDLECQTRSPISWVFPRFDRLVLPREDVVDDEKLAKIVQATADRKLMPYQGERTRDFRGRGLNCSNLRDADLRRVDLTGARMSGTFLDGADMQDASLDCEQPMVFHGCTQLQGASLYGARLQGASLSGAQLQGASLYGAQLQGASLREAQLQGASLEGAELQGASLEGAELQGASLNFAQLQGAPLRYAELQGASLFGAQLQGASLDRAQLQGANLELAQLQGASLSGSFFLGRAQLQGASLREAQLQGASLEGAELQGASLEGAELQGASLNRAALTETVLSNAAVWRASYVPQHIRPNWKCEATRVKDSKYDAIIQFGCRGLTPVCDLPATREATGKFIENSVADIPDPRMKQRAIKRMQAGLVVDPPNDDTKAIEEHWRKCEKASAEVPQAEFDKMHAAVLRNVVCAAEDSRDAIARGIIRNWISDRFVIRGDRRAFSAQLARGLLGEDGKPCAATKDLDQADIKKLCAAIAAAPSPHAPAPPAACAPASPAPAAAASAPPSNAVAPAAAAPSPTPSQASPK